MRAQQASTLTGADLSRNTHLNRKNLLKITLLGYTVGRARVTALSRMSIPKVGFGDGGPAETEAGGNQIGSGWGSETVVEGTAHRPDLDLDLRLSP